MPSNAPAHLDVKKDRGLTVQWPDGTTSYYTVAYLRRMSPSADMRQLREQMEANPLTILPASAPGRGDIAIADAELIGNYAISFTFTDGHATGIYTWEYLREIDPAGRKGDQPGG